MRATSYLQITSVRRTEPLRRAIDLGWCCTAKAV